MTSTPSPRSRIFGCLLGAAASEAFALAGTAATDDAASSPLRLGPAGQLSFYTADALIEVLEWANAGVYADQAACVWLAYLRWASGQGIPLPPSTPSAPARWIDGQTATSRPLGARPAWAASLAGGEMGSAARPLGAAFNDGAAAARSAPFGLVVGTPGETVVTMALDGAHLTHGHPSAVQSAVVLASAVRDLMDETPLHEAAHNARSLMNESRSPAEDVIAALEAALEDGGSPSGASPAARSLSSALAAALAAERGASHGVDGRPVPADFRAAVVRAASSGPDAAAMAGALLGALWGAAAVPPEWTGRLEGADVAEELAATLAKASGAES